MSQLLDDMACISMAARAGAEYGQAQRDAEFRVVDYVRTLEAKLASNACSDAIDEAFRLADGKPEWDYPGQLVHLVRSLLKDRDRVTELEASCDRMAKERDIARGIAEKALVAPRLMSEAPLRQGATIRIRAVDGWHVATSVNGSFWIDAFSEHDEIIRGAIAWLPLFPDDETEVTP